MGLFSLLNFFRRSETETHDYTNERRARRSRCDECGHFTFALVYLNNGGLYCQTCARTMRKLFRHEPAGRRSGDIVQIEEDDAESRSA